MEISDLMKNIKTLTSYQIEQKFDELIRQNYHFNHLDESNRTIVLDLIKNYRDHVVHGIPITSQKIRDDMYNLYEKRLSLKLTQNDLDDIRKFLQAFQD